MRLCIFYKATGSEEPVTTDNLNEAVVVAVSQSETIGDDKKKKTCGKRLTKQKSSMDGKPSPGVLCESCWVSHNN